MDILGPDTGAENVANFIRTRTTAGSYHDVVDSDSAVQLMPYEYQAFQDGTGSNPWALSISWAVRTTDWSRMSSSRRAAHLRQGALAFARQQAWLKSKGYPLTLLRRITKAESDRGYSGFIPHADRDPGRRTDPGVNFPWGEFFAACAAAVNPTPISALEDQDMYQLLETVDTGRLYAYAPGQMLWIPTPDFFYSMVACDSFPNQTDETGRVAANDVFQSQVDQTIATMRDHKQL